MAVDAFTYGANPAQNTRDAVRMLAGDTRDVAKALRDSEVDFFLQRYGLVVNAYTSADYMKLTMAAAEAAEALANRYAEEASYGVGGASEASNQKAAEYTKVAKRLRARAALTAMPIWVGMTTGEKEAADADSGAVQPFFKRTQFDNPGVAALTSLTDGL